MWCIHKVWYTTNYEHKQYSNKGHVGKRHDRKTRVNFKIYDVASWETSPEVKPIRQVKFRK